MAKGAIQSKRAGIGKVEAEVGAHRLGRELDAPFAGIFQPYGEVGVKERKRQLLIAGFEVHPGIARVDVREARQTSGMAFGGRRLGYLGGLREQSVEIPFALADCAPG